ncbi:VOC family protein [Marmoricola endophyticus]|uniref:VOC family protein n=1 Tax=Marmoricola endophyticus TaxID=2040280 RepID=UPI001E3B197B|nr:VOC family protein [Marmoricola endophyticus]
MPNLTVPDLAAAVAEHTAVLGLRPVMDHRWIVTLADADGHQLSLMTTDATATVNPDVSIFLVSLAEVEAAHDAATAAGLAVVHPLSREEWGVTRFFYRDSAGRVVNVGTHT